jgi:hypothetical protein
MMRSLLRLGPAAALVLAIAALSAGCGKGTSSTGTGTPLTQDAADDIAIQTQASLNVVGGDLSGSISGSVGPRPQFVMQPLSMLLDTVFTKNGITYHLTRTFYDSTGAVLAVPGPNVAKIHTTGTATGSFETQRDTATISHATSLTIDSVLATKPNLVVNGQSADTLMNTYRSYDGTTTRYFHWVSSLTIGNVQFVKATLGSGHPASGTVTFTADADRLRSNNAGDIAAHYHVTVVVVFDGTNIAQITVNGTYHYLWNLDTDAIVRA